MKNPLRDETLMPIYDPADAITEIVFVETDLDIDMDGRRDRIAVYIRCPGETEDGLKVPALYTANPYAAGWMEELYHLHNVDEDPIVKEIAPQNPDAMRFSLGSREALPHTIPTGEATHAERPPEYEELEASMNPLQAYMLPRGVATVFSGSPGTRRSDGICGCGSADEVQAVVSVIEWLHGSRRAFTSREGSVEISAWWCSGNVGMCGKSYLGTLAIAAAAANPPGLRCILAESAISNWYRYYRENGLVSAAMDWQGDDADLLALSCNNRMLDEEDYDSVRDVSEEYFRRMQLEQDRAGANYSKFWDERNYLNNAADTKAAVCIIHGLNDWNVKPIHFADYWRTLREGGASAKMILHQGEHDYINTDATFGYYAKISRWLAHHLQIADSNPDEYLPDVSVQSNLDSSIWHTGSDWPPKAAVCKRYKLGEDWILGGSAESQLRTWTDDVAASGYDRDADNRAEWRSAFVSEPPGERADRLLYMTEPLSETLRISGRIRADLHLASNRPTGILSVMIVDYGAAYRLGTKAEVVEENGIDCGFGRTEKLTAWLQEKEPSEWRIITRGHMNLQNRDGIFGASEVLPGIFYDYELELHPMDYTVPAGRRIGMLIYGSDMDMTLRPQTVFSYSLKPEKSALYIPEVTA